MSPKAAVKSKTKAKEEKAVYFEAVGRRKSAVARARLFKDKKRAGIYVNENAAEKYFPLAEIAAILNEPLKLTKTEGEFHVSVSVYGGGTRAQAEAVRLAISRALLKFNPELRGALKKEMFLKRDARVKERRKFGLKKARKAPQWSKR